MVNESMAMTRQEILLSLKKNGKDNVLQTIDNCIFVLEHDENLRGTIRFNVLTERDCIVGDVGSVSYTHLERGPSRGHGKQLSRCCHVPFFVLWEFVRLHLEK